jgi:lipopolysaccharide/colanic/teichoic acid biosynthesis glycosyltransferase
MYQRYFKRLFDIVSATTLLMAISPIMLVLSIMIKSKLGSPILFTQLRPGKECKILKCINFDL